MLVLFDIDGTLVQRASREHAEALHAAIRRVHRIEIPAERVEAAGRTDPAIARAILTLAGVSAARVDERWPELRRLTVEEFARRCPEDLTDKVAPGVPELLAALAARPGVRLSLVTGNLEPVARLKLRRAGLGAYFAAGQGAFGSDDEDRAALPPIARARAAVGGAPYPRERTVVVGDTPRDIACARADGLRVVAVATGPFAIDALGDADAVVPDARGVLDALGAYEPGSIQKPS